MGCARCNDRGKVKESGWDGRWIPCDDCAGTGSAELGQRLKRQESELARLREIEAKYAELVKWVGLLFITSSEDYVRYGAIQRKLRELTEAYSIELQSAIEERKERG